MTLAGKDDPAPLFSLFLDLIIHHPVQFCHWTAVRRIARRVWTPPGPAVLSQAPAVAYLVSLPGMSAGSLRLPVCARLLVLLSPLHVHSLRTSARTHTPPTLGALPRFRAPFHGLPHICLAFHSSVLHCALLDNLLYCHMIILSKTRSSSHARTVSQTRTSPRTQHHVDCAAAA